MDKPKVKLSAKTAKWIADNHSALERIAHYLAKSQASGKKVSSSALRYFVREELGINTPSECFAEIVTYVEAHRPRLKGVYGTRRKSS